MAALSHRSRSPRGRIVAIVIGVALVLLVVLGALLARDVLTARSAVADTTSEARAFRVALSDGDAREAARRLAALQSSTTRAADATDGPLWAVAARVPVVGDDVDAVRIATSTVRDIARRGLPPLVGVAGELDGDLFKPVDGRFDLSAFEAVQGPVGRADEVLQIARERLDVIEVESLVSRLQGPMGELIGTVDDAQDATSAATLAVDLAPGMLGADGPRTYIVLFQNNAELRTTGGIPGSMALLRADRGTVRLDDSFSKSDIGLFSDIVTPVSDAEIGFAGDTIASDYRDVNLVPEFPRTGELVRAMAARRPGVDIDGVLSMDPVALSYALRGLGDVDVGSGFRLSADNAVGVLLNEAYLRFDGAGQDAFFTVAAQRVFAQVLAGRGDSIEVLRGLVQAVQERRVLIWSARESEEQVLTTTALGGSIAQGDGAPRIGVYLNDATGSKLQYFLRWETSVSGRQCLDGDRQRLTMTTRFTSTLPADTSQMPDYIGGPSDRGRSGRQLIAVKLGLPTGATVEAFEQDRSPGLYDSGSLVDRPFAMTTVDVPPGGVREVAVTFTTRAGDGSDLIFDTTPGVAPVRNGRIVAGACSQEFVDQPE